MALMTLRGYGRHRGCSPEAVRRAIASGRIPVAKQEKRGKRTLKWVDSQECDRLWAQNSDPVQQRVATRAECGRAIADPRRTPPEPNPPADSVPISLFPEPDQEPQDRESSQSVSKTAAGSSEYSQARARRETYLAKTAELDFLEKANKLADAERLQVEWFNAGKRLQQNLFNIPARVADGIYAQVHDYLAKTVSGEEGAVFNKRSIQDVIKTEIMLVLRDLSNVETI